MAKVDRIPIARPDIGELEKENVRRCIESGWISQGPFVSEAEDRLKAITGRKFAICTSSGTMALIAALLCVKDTPTDLRHQNWTQESVAVPTMIFAAVHNAVKLAALTPVYAASDSMYWQVSEDELYRVFGVRILVIAPCYGGIAGSNASESGRVHPKTTVIEDCAESWGGILDGKPAGSFGDVSCVSWFANKICTASEGGALLTDDPELAQRLRTVINHGIEGKSYIPKYVGFNGRMSDVAAAILCAQLERMPGMLQRRRYIMAEYVSSAGPEWRLPKILPTEDPAPWLFAGIHTDVKDVQKRADAANIEWRQFFPVPKEAGEMKETRFISENGICLPLSSTLTDDEVERVCDVIKGK